ncbi:MAG: fibronectin type III-like domain-contianing protein, partial [Oscillibacter sp.]|nr:fibronectin type III-like domain-contianing protein [Oscillibacter sp.]
MEIEELKMDGEIDAILWVGEPGIYGFYGVADVLAGNANPSGHLPDTWAINSASTPAMGNFGLYLYSNNSQNGSGNKLTTDNKADWYVVETEGIYQGYKYYETRYADAVLGQGNADAAEGSSTEGGWNYANEISYPFGYGGSYTTFSQTLDSLDVRLGGIGSASVTVTNTGDAAGKSVVQLYVQTPYTPGGLEKAAIQLIGFAKTSELAPGGSETVTIDIDPALFASYDEAAVKLDGTEGAWVLEGGDYWFSIGNGAHEALNNILTARQAVEAVDAGTEVPAAETPAALPENLVLITADETVNPASAAVWTLNETDMETYSVGVKNAIQNADINKLIPGTAEYTTRADWTKGWKTVESITPTEEMMTGLTNSNYALTPNGDGVTWGADNGLSFVSMTLTDDEGRVVGAVDFDDPLWDQLVEQVTLDEAIHFIEWAADDMENIDSVMLPRIYMNDGPLGFAFDQVAGYKTRWTANDKDVPTYVSDQPEAGYSMTSMPTEPVVAAAFNVELVEREGQLIGEDALYAHESILIAPGLNLHRTPYCARNHEYYSEDSVLTNLLGKRFCAGTASKGLAAQVKHLAFNHQELNRAGISTFFTEQAARENELRCFQGAMSENLTATVMTAFNRAGTVYVGAHSGVLEQIARNEWGFLGGYVTDMVNGAMYMNWLDTVAGGGGTMLGSSANWTGTTLGTMEASKSAIAKDTFFQEKMQYTLKTWLYALAQSNAVNGLSTTTKMVTVYPWWLMAQFIADGAFALLALLFVVLALRARRKDTEAGGKNPGIVFAVLSVIAETAAVCLYRGSYNTTLGSWICLGAAVAAAAVSLMGSRDNPQVWNWGAPAAAILTAAGIALSVTVMADPIGYVISGLYPPETLTGYITFGVAACAAWLLCLITGFTGMAKES